MTLENQLEAYMPVNEQEARDCSLMLRFLREGETPFSRENETAHFTASAWVTNAARDRVLMAFHNIYHSWAWTGGHADGETDLAAVARREAAEETGVSGLRLVSEMPVSLEIITVDGHEKRGRYVPSHLHYNVTYLFEADDDAPLTAKPDENSGVRWIPLDELAREVSEPPMLEVYQKIAERIRSL